MNLEPSHEQTLISQAQTGSNDAFNELFGHYQEMVYQYAMSAIGEHNAACDAAQETLIWAWQNIGKFQYKEGGFKFWLLAACKNKNRQVAEGRRPSDEIYYRLKREAGVLNAHPPSQDDFDLTDIELKPRISRRKKKKIIQLLPPTQRRVYLLWKKRYRYQEIANALGISVPSVRQNLSRARKRLKQNAV